MKNKKKKIGVAFLCSIPAVVGLGVTIGALASTKKQETQLEILEPTAAEERIAQAKTTFTGNFGEEGSKVKYHLTFPGAFTLLSSGVELKDITASADLKYNDGTETHVFALTGVGNLVNAQNQFTITLEAEYEWSSTATAATHLYKVPGHVAGAVGGVTYEIDNFKINIADKTYLCTSGDYKADLISQFSLPANTIESKRKIVYNELTHYREDQIVAEFKMVELNSAGTFKTKNAWGDYSVKNNKWQKAYTKLEFNYDADTKVADVSIYFDAYNNIENGDTCELTSLHAQYWDDGYIIIYDNQNIENVTIRYNDTSASGFVVTEPSTSAERKATSSMFGFDSDFKYLHYNFTINGNFTTTDTLDPYVDCISASAILYYEDANGTHEYPARGNAIIIDDHTFSLSISRKCFDITLSDDLYKLPGGTELKVKNLRINNSKTNRYYDCTNNDYTATIIPTLAMSNGYFGIDEGLTEISTKLRQNPDFIFNAYDLANPEETDTKVTLTFMDGTNFQEDSTSSSFTLSDYTEVNIPYVKQFRYTTQVKCLATAQGYYDTYFNIKLTNKDGTIVYLDNPNYAGEEGIYISCYVSGE